MHPQLQQIDDELRAARERLHRLAERVPPERWAERPPQGGWSPAECVEHLNLTSRAVLPELQRALAEAKALGGGAPSRYRRGMVGWLIWRSQRPGGGMKSKTPASFVPLATASPAEQRAEFERLQEAQAACLVAGDGLPLQRVKVASPFGPIRYNAFAALSILAIHQLRHLDQAERAWEAVRAAG
jgi:hypothetical protein